VIAWVVFFFFVFLLLMRGRELVCLFFGKYIFEIPFAYIRC
jgi:hypothetical protein